MAAKMSRQKVPAWAVDSHWSVLAACASVDPELFFAPKGRADMTQNAKRICAECPVIDQCRRYALTNPDIDGVLGGMTSKERQQQRRRQRRAK